MMQSLINVLLLASSALALPTSRTTEPTCTAKSLKVTDWTIKDFDFHSSYTFSTPAHQNSYGYVNFTLVNPAISYRSTCSASSSQLEDFFYGTLVYDCDVPTNNTDAAVFTFDRPTGDLKVNQTWSCPEESSRFSAAGGVTLDLDCEETAWQNPNWQEGEIYSTRLITCAPVTVEAPIETISAVM